MEHALFRAEIQYVAFEVFAGVHIEDDAVYLAEDVRDTLRRNVEKNLYVVFFPAIANQHANKKVASRQ